MPYARDPRAYALWRFDAHLSALALRFQLLSDFSLPKDRSCLPRSQRQNQHSQNLLPRRRHQLLPSQARLQTGRPTRTTTSTASTSARRGNGADGRSERRTAKRKPSFRTGMISTIRRDRITTRSTRIAMKRSPKSESGSVGCMRIVWRGRRVETRIARVIRGQ